jgi:hypothetical protein
MKNCILIFAILFASTSTAGEFDLKKFAHTYFDTWVLTQAANATTKDMENYLALLADDVGHSHLPWYSDDSRLADGKESFRKGMTFYLAAHTEYKAELLDVFTFNSSAVAIRYRSSSKGIHPQTKEYFSDTEVMMEVLEIENGKVAVIRKYHE